MPSTFRLAALSLVGLFLGTAAWVCAAEPPPITVHNVWVAGMRPTSIVQSTRLRQTTPFGEPLAAVFAQAETQSGGTTLDQVLRTRNSIGIYRFEPTRALWMPLWERVTGELGIDFVEGYDVLDVNDDGNDDVCVRVRYYGPSRALDFSVKTIEPDGVHDLFELRSLYQGKVTASAGRIFVSEGAPGHAAEQQVYQWDLATHAFQKVIQKADHDRNDGKQPH